VLLHNIGVGVPNRDSGSFLDHVKLLIESHQVDAAMLVSNDAFGNLVGLVASIASALADDLDGVDTEVHGDSGAGFHLRHGDKGGLCECWCLGFWGSLHLNFQ